MLKSAQVTVIIFLVLIMLFVFLIVFYISGLVTTEQTTREIVSSQVSPIDVSSVKTYVESCLNKVASKGLYVLGRSGGVIYWQDGGFSNGTATVDYQFYGNHRVRYTINIPKGNVPPYNTSLPWYPYRNATADFPYPNISDTSKISVIGYYGISLLPPLYKPGNHSIEEQLENYTTKEVSENCTNNWDYFEMQGLEIKNGSMFINFTFTEREVLVEMNYPLTISKEGIENVEKLSYFAVKIPVRLKRIYNFTNITIIKEITNISFNITSAPYDGIFVNVTRDVYKHDDLINVTDSQSVLFGRPFEFWFLRRNRAPALYWIDPATVPNDRNMGDSTELNVTFVDPDEDHIFTAFYPPLMNGSSMYCNVSVNDTVYTDFQEVLFP